MKAHCLKIYTSKAVVKALAKRAQQEGRSISKHGEYLIKQGIANAAPEKVVTKLNQERG